jgi:hypothetical protein
VADRSVDAAICIDVLEHIEPRSRPAVLTELMRVSRKHIAVAFPSGDEARREDVRTEHQYRADGLKPPDWLVEHLRHPFPEADSLKETLRAAGGNRIQMERTINNEGLRLQRLHRYLARRVPWAYKVFTLGCWLGLPLLALSRGRGGSYYRSILIVDLFSAAGEKRSPDHPRDSSKPSKDGR